MSTLIKIITTFISLFPFSFLQRELSFIRLKHYILLYRQYVREFLIKHISPQLYVSTMTTNLSYLLINLLKKVNIWNTKSFIVTQTGHLQIYLSWNILMVLIKTEQKKVNFRSTHSDITYITQLHYLMSLYDLKYQGIMY